MGRFDREGIEGIARRTMVLFFLIDTSGSMHGSKIGEVNDAIEGVLPELKEISNSNTDALIKVAALNFSTGADWMYQDPVDVNDFKWHYVEAGGVTEMGEAFKKLNEKMSRQQYMQDISGSYAPAIFLLSDGAPTDDYKKYLDQLKKNNWFKYALKAAVAIGDDADKSMLAEFTGNSETVMNVHSPEALKKVIRFVSVTASKIGSKSSNAGEEASTKQEDFAEQVTDFKEELIDTENDNW
ncbi:MAG: VWA domain-containing protein [Clostridia bacterium]|nr:VWA domain-containing protein [Clostridia bacterium]